MVEGLVGVKDQGNAFDKVLIAPRWEAANENNVNTTIKYEASNGYVSYHYLKTESEIQLVFTGTQEETDLQILLPKNKQVEAAFINGRSTKYQEFKIESSNYIRLNIRGKGVYKMIIKLNY
ncbi:MAG: hypothetical protein DRJ07_11805 [Bacteroidetes bacterium]|nr:MAG: hypothetical protein DRJ07_11805 [Bacteroidota bacterium]